MRMLISAAVAAAVLVGGVEAQVPLDADPGRSEQTREDLERLLTLYQEVLDSPVYSDDVKRAVGEDMGRIRTRLSRGDFRVGDRIVLYVQGEAGLPETVTVRSGPLITLPLFGDIPLEGVLRSEIEDHLTRHLSNFIRDPVVQAHGLIRVSIQGAVMNQGFFTVPADILLGDALMLAGGPAPVADLEELRIERGEDILIEGQELQQAMREGWTLDQLNLQAGDQIVLPVQSDGFTGNLPLLLGIASSLTLIIVNLGR